MSPDKNNVRERLAINRELFRCPLFWVGYIVPDIRIDAINVQILLGRWIVVYR